MSKTAWATAMIHRSLAILSSLALITALFVVAVMEPVRASSSVFINEIHYDNQGADSGEAVEVAGPAGTDLTGWKIVLYNGANGRTYGTITLSGTIDNENSSGYGALSFTKSGIQNGPDGLALVDASDTNNVQVVEFISYEGSAFAATNGDANGMTSTVIGVVESGSTPAGHSLQLTGSGTTASDFTWAAPKASSFGTINTGQTFTTTATTSATTTGTTTGTTTATTTATTSTTSTTSTTMPPTPPNKPTGLTAAVAGDGAVRLSWDDPSDASITGYKYQQAEGSGAFGSSISIPDSAPNGIHDTSFNVIGLTNGTAYRFVILAVSSGGDSDPSDPATARPAQPDRSVFINELHYDDLGADSGEAVEVAGPAGTDLTGWSIVLYNGNGGRTYGSKITLSGTIDNENNSGYGALSFTKSGIQNGPDGLALVNADSVVIEFISYEGVFTAVGGPADGMTSTDIGVAESNSTTPDGHSLQLTGSGTTASDFTWAAPQASTFGTINTGQTLTMPTAPAQPTGLTAGARDGAVRLTWNDPADTRITRYEYQQRQGQNAFGTTWTTIPNSAPDETNATSFTVTPLTNGNTYTFRIRAVNTIGNSDPSTTATARPTAPTAAPRRPTGFAAVAFDGAVRLTWNDPADTRITRYEYQQRQGQNAFDATWTTIPNSAPDETNATSFTVTPLTNGNTYTFRIRAVNTIGNSDPSTTATATAGQPLISQVQGSGGAVAVTGRVTVEAIVTSLFEDDDTVSGFFVQEEVSDSDGDPATSEGIYVYCRSGTTDVCPAGLAVGDKVTATGMTEEFFGMSQIDAADGGSVTIVSSDNPLPTATRVSLPASGSTEAEETFESVEGMLVTFPGRLVVSEYFELARYGQLVLTHRSRPYQFTHRHAPSASGYREFLDDLATKQIILDDDNSDQNDGIFPVGGTDEAYPYPEGGLSNTNRFRGGDSIRGLTGVMHWANSAWRIRPVPEKFDYSFTADNPRPARPKNVGGRLRVASFNVLNYFTTLDTGTPSCGPQQSLGCRGANSMAELDRQRAKIVAAMVAIDADILGLLEIENDPSASLIDLVGGLNAATSAGTYAYIDTGTIGSDAIKVALIYRPATVTPVGSHVIIDSSTDPDYIDTKNRPGLIQTFEEVSSDHRFTVAINHLKSKGSDCDELGDRDLDDGQANCSQTRTKAARALARYLATDPTGSEDPDVLIMGDLNAYAREDPITALEAAGYTNLIRRFVGADTYSFVFDSQIGYLDHALASRSLLPQVVGVTEWHINADEPPLFDYNDDVADPGERSHERESAAQPIYEANPFRSSDHDPVIIGLQLGRRPPPTTPPPPPPPPRPVDPPVVPTPFTDTAEVSTIHADNIGRIYGLGFTKGSSSSTFSPDKHVSQRQAASFLARLYRVVEGEDALVVETPFTDLKGLSYSQRGNIGRVYGLGVMTGTSGTTFSPRACVTRGQMATFLARLYKAVKGEDAPVVETPFTDLKEGESYAHRLNIRRVYGLGITVGISSTTYSPDDCTTRQQMASFLYRFYRILITT